MKNSILVVAVVCLAIPGMAADVEVEVLDEIIAKVNGRIITKTDIERARETFVEDLKARQVPESEIQARLDEQDDHFLRDRIDNLLLIQKGEQLDVKVDREVSKYLADLMVQYKAPDQDQLATLIRERTGMRFEDFKEEVKNGILTQRVLGMEVGSRVVIPREEIEAYYKEHQDEFMREERVFLSEILISTDGLEGDALAGAEKEAKDLVERARRGEKFEELAREHSDAVTAEAGGDLGGWKRSDLRQDLADLIWDKEKNHVTDPIKVQGGYLILKVRAHHQAGLAHIEEVENEIMNKLYPPRFQPLVREYLTELRQQAFLEIKDGYVDTAAAPGKDTSWSDPAMLVPETVTREEVLSKTRRKKLLWLIPIPGTKQKPKSSSKSLR